MSNPVVSVVTPMHNAADTIKESVDSVRAQTFQAWEMIVVDDGSEDASVAIVRDIMREEPRLRLLQNDTAKGAAAARNKAIEAAKGRYIAFLDADDVWLEHKLETQLDLMKKNDAAMVYSPYYIADETLSRRRLFVPPPRVAYEDLLKTCSIGCLTAMYDSKKVGKRLMPDISRRQDYALWLQIVKEFGSAISTDEPTALYRLMRGSVSSNKLRAAIYQWKVYRDIEKLPWHQAIYYLGWYAWYGIKKYFIPSFKTSDYKTEGSKNGFEKR